MRYLRHQPNSFTCGPSALRNAMLVHGVRVDIRRVTKVSGITKTTIDTVPGLRVAAEHFDFRLLHKKLYSPEEVFEVLPKELPALLCVDRYEHWVTALEASTAFVTICDPARGGELVQKLTWLALARRLVYGLADDQRFDIYPVRHRETT